MVNSFNRMYSMVAGAQATTLASEEYNPRTSDSLEVNSSEFIPSKPNIITIFDNDSNFLTLLYQEKVNNVLSNITVLEGTDGYIPKLGDYVIRSYTNADNETFRNNLEFLRDVTNDLSHEGTVITERLSSHELDTNNPHNVTATQIGVSPGAEVNAINTVSLNGNDIQITNTHLNIAIDKSSVGLNNVDNTSDLNKPISTRTSTAINAVDTKIKSHLADLNNPHHVTKVNVGLSKIVNQSDSEKVNDNTNPIKMYVDDAEASAKLHAESYVNSKVSTIDAKASTALENSITAISDASTAMTSVNTVSTNFGLHRENKNNPHSVKVRINGNTYVSPEGSGTIDVGINGSNIRMEGNKTATIKSYTDTSASSTLTSAKSYTDTSASSTLTSAKSYTDTSVSSTVKKIKINGGSEISAVNNVAGLTINKSTVGLNNVIDGAQPNTIETISLNGTAQSISNKNVNIPVDGSTVGNIIVNDITIPADAWTADTTYERYPYKKDIEVLGMTENHIPYIVFGDAYNHMLSPYVISSTDKVTIFSIAESMQQIIIKTIAGFRT